MLSELMGKKDTASALLRKSFGTAEVTTTPAAPSAPGDRPMAQGSVRFYSQDMFHGHSTNKGEQQTLDVNNITKTLKELQEFLNGSP